MQSTSSQSILWQEIDLFFMSQGKVYDTLRKLAQVLTQAEIDYVIVGGMALALHGYVRMTQDVDVLLSQTGLEKFQEKLVGRGYVRAFPNAQKMFKDTLTGVSVEIITSGEYPGDGKPKAVSFPEPETVGIDLDGLQVISLAALIELKLASGLTAPDRLKDLADVQELIRTLNLSHELALALDESVRSEYLRLWTTIQPVK